jgi:hypothetical protein
MGAVRQGIHTSFARSSFDLPASGSGRSSYSGTGELKSEPSERTTAPFSLCEPRGGFVLRASRPAGCLLSRDIVAAGAQESVGTGLEGQPGVGICSVWQTGRRKAAADAGVECYGRMVGCTGDASAAGSPWGRLDSRAEAA